MPGRMRPGVSSRPMARTVRPPLPEAPPAPRGRRVTTRPPAPREHVPATGTPPAVPWSDPAIAQLLHNAVEEAARLLDADGAIVYLLDPADNILRFAHDAGISDVRRRRWVRRLQLEVGQGMFGVAVAGRRVVSTADYPNDHSFEHSPAADRFVREVGIRSMVVAPLVAGERVFGGLGTYSARPFAFSEAHHSLVRALADHAAAAMANMQLIEDLDRSRAEIARRADAERALREIAIRISSIRDQGQVIQQAVDEAARLLDADGARIDLVDPSLRLLRWAYQSGAERPTDEQWPEDPDETLEQGVSGKALVEGIVFTTGDYLADGRFKHGIGSDTYIGGNGIRSVMAAPLRGEEGPFGTITVYTTRPDAWTDRDAELLEALGNQAAIAIRNASLIEELGRSREALGRRAEAEQALREIAARITAIRDPSELLQHVVDEANRLVRADGTILDLLEPSTNILHWAYDSGLKEIFSPAEIADLWLPVGEGLTGIAVAEDRVITAGDDLVAEFPVSSQSELFFSRTSFRSLIAAPIAGDAGRLGVLEVYSKRPHAFDPADAALIGALADQAAIAITNARLIEVNERARVELQRRADAERTLRQIAAGISAIRDADDVLQQAISEASRLLRADGAIIDVLDPESGQLRWAYDAGMFRVIDRETVEATTIKLGEGISGRAVAERRVLRTDDYLADGFVHTAEADAFARRFEIRSVIVAPVIAEAGPVGAIEVYTKRPNAFDDLDETVLGGLADQVAIAIQNARLIEALNRSRDEIRRRAETEGALRRIAANISAIRDPDVVLQQTVDEAQRLLESDEARIDLIEGDTLVWTYTSTESRIGAFRDLDAVSNLDDGIAALAIRRRGPVNSPDYLTDTSFIHTPASDEFVRRVGIRAVIAVPLLADSGALGAISVSSERTNAYGPADEELLQALADQASIAIQNTRLIAELERSRSALAHRADTERSLRQIAARIAELRDPDELLRQVVEESRRLLGSDGAHLTRMSDDGTYVAPVVVAGGLDAETDEWLRSQQFPLNGGINGLAAGTGSPVWTDDYRTDPRIPHEADDELTAATLGLCGMAAVPLRAPEGEIVGTLAVSFREPHRFDDDEIALLQGLADHAAIAMTNTHLYERVRDSEAAYRHLVQNSPDLIWAIDADGRFTFLSDTCERLTGWTPDDLIGRHFGALVHDQSREVAELDWTTGMSGPSQELRGRLYLLHRDGHPVPAEFVAIGSLDADGNFSGANGSVRDMTDLDRLERDLRESEARFRQLVQTTPDVIWRTDADGRFSFVADSAEALFGWSVEEILGRHFTFLAAPETERPMLENWTHVTTERETVQWNRWHLRRKDGSIFPAEVSAVGVFEGDTFVAAQGTARDVSERERLERELRESEQRYRFLVQNAPDIIFSTDAEGRFTYLSETLERITGYPPTEWVGQHFSGLVDPETLPLAVERWNEIVEDPGSIRVTPLNLVHRSGALVPVEVSAIGMLDGEGRFSGIHGATRDVTERRGLERHLRQQAAELAAGEERAHLARELHDSVTQALFSMTLQSRSIELLVDRDAAAAKAKLGDLRDLQREALAEMRALIFELRPGNIERDGLLHALRTHSAALQGRIGLPIVVQSDVSGRFPIEIEEVLYRIAQEALHNVVKHAAARQVRIELSQAEDALTLRIVDDGKGFDPRRVPEGHLGLAGMRARAEKIGARFEVRSLKRNGTTIEVVVPLAVAVAAGPTAAK